jgi:hypothetical protein
MSFGVGDLHRDFSYKYNFESHHSISVGKGMEVVPVLN